MGKGLRNTGLVVMILTYLLCCPVVLLAEDGEEKLEAQIIFTHGPGGPIRESAEFQTEEDPHAFVWITGLRARPEDKGHATVSVTMRYHDPSGKLLNESTFIDNLYWELLGPGVEAVYINLKLEGNNFSEEAYELSVELEHTETGKRVTTSRKLWTKPVKDLSIIQYQFALARDPSFAPGKFLQAGRDHLLILQLLNMMVKDNKVRLRVSTLACDKNGNPYHAEAKTHEIDMAIAAKEGEYPIGRIEIPFTPNRAGEQILRVTVEDLNSGEKTTRDIPCPVISVFDDTEKPVPSPPRGLLSIDMCLTRGEFGSPRPNNIYYANDTIHSQVRIAGLTTNAKGEGEVDFRATLTDEAGAVIYDLEQPTLSHSHLHGKDVLEMSLFQTTNLPKTMAGPVTWALQFTDRVSGATGFVSQQLLVNPDQDLHTTGHCFYLGENSNVPAGSLLQVGRPYHLSATVCGSERKNSTHSIEAKLVGVDLQGNRLSDYEVNLSRKVAVSRYTEPVKSLSLKQAFRLNRSGQFALRLIVTDKHSGQVSIEDIPITVVGHGPNDPVEKSH